jgi:integrase/recombinase XerD
MGGRPETIDNYRDRLTAILEHGAGEVTAPALRALSDERRHAAGTRREYFKSARTFCRWAVENGHLTADPLKRASLPAAPAPRPKPVTGAELTRLLDGTTSTVRPWFVLAAYAGLRASEIAELRVEDLKVAGDGTATLEVYGKGGQLEPVPARPEVVALFAGRKHGRLFQTGGRNISARACEEMIRLGVPGGIHRLRHTFGTAVYRQTNDVMQAKTALRHRSIGSTMHYVTADDRTVRSTIGQLYGTPAHRHGGMTVGAGS